MDPHQTFLDMTAAMQDGEYDTARELALALRKWLAKGGFYPADSTREEIDEKIAYVLTGDRRNFERGE